MSVSRRTILGAAGAAAFAPAARAQGVTIDYWQYYFKERVAAMDELIAQFQQANPGITVRHSHFPYAQYRTKVGAAVPAGEGPDVLQLYYGWLRDYRRANLLQKLPADLFAPDAVDAAFFPVVQQMRDGGAYWALPTAIRSLGLFANRRLLEAARRPVPATLDDMVATALAIDRAAAGHFSGAAGVDDRADGGAVNQLPSAVVDGGAARRAAERHVLAAAAADGGVLGRSAGQDKHVVAGRKHRSGFGLAGAYVIVRHRIAFSSRQALAAQAGGEVARAGVTQRASG